MHKRTPIVEPPADWEYSACRSIRTAGNSKRLHHQEHRLSAFTRLLEQGN